MAVLEEISRTSSDHLRYPPETNVTVLRIITSSIANGPLVLRHELGHSIIEVGEEYDGGDYYFGVNAMEDLKNGISWSHWLTEPIKATGPPPHVERSVMPIQIYPWTLLNTSDPWSIKFSASGLYSRHIVRFSLSGLPGADDLSVMVDGKDLKWEPKADIGVDRWHYDIPQDGGLSDGEHEVKFILKNKDREGEAQLCSMEILEFGDETE